jgi:rubrerythrin
MTDITDITNKKIFLEVCMGIEKLCADVYHFYSEIFEDIPEASRLWKKTALEEENHQMQFGLALRMLSETEFEVPKESLKRAYSVQDKLLDLINHVKVTRPDLLTAVSKAVEMEEKLADLHAYTSLHFKDESMQKLFKSLSKADHGHIADLQRYRTILYLPQSEMEEVMQDD